MRFLDYEIVSIGKYDELVSELDFKNREVAAIIDEIQRNKRNTK